MPRLSVPAMVAAARRYGLTVEVVPGAETRGSANYHPQVFVGHHTAGPATGIRPSLAICINGRGGANPVPGPLCNWFLDRNGVVVIVAAGLSNNAGKGSFRGLSGNVNTMGCEAESTGLGPDGNWTVQQLWAYPRVVAAGLDLMGRDESWYCAHRTWTPRKVDPTGLSDAWMRTRVAEVMADHTRNQEDLSMADVDDILTAIGGIKGQLDTLYRGDRSPTGNELNDPGDTHALGSSVRTAQYVAGIDTKMEGLEAKVGRLEDAVGRIEAALVKPALTKPGSAS